MQTESKQKSEATYKDTLLRKIYREKAHAIELCNALEGTAYTNNAKVKFCGLEDTLALRYNDVAFAVENQLIMFTEHPCGY